MKSAIYSIVLVAGLAAAQSNQIPSCATTCVSQYTSNSRIADCGQFDVKCICSNEEFLDGIACCLEDACDEEGRKAAVNYAKSICTSSGVTVPDEVVCKGSGSSTSRSSTQSSTTGSAAVATNTDDDDSATSTAASEAAATTTSEPNAAVKGGVGILGAALAVIAAI